MCGIIGHVFSMGREVFENLDTRVVDPIFDMLLNLMKVDENGVSCSIYAVGTKAKLKKKNRETVCYVIYNTYSF